MSIENRRLVTKTKYFNNVTMSLFVRPTLCKYQPKIGVESFAYNLVKPLPRGEGRIWGLRLWGLGVMGRLTSKRCKKNDAAM